MRMEGFWKGPGPPRGKATSFSTQAPPAVQTPPFSLHPT